MAEGFIPAMHVHRRSIVCVVAGIILGCTDTPSGRPGPSHQGVILQRQRNTCGVAALAMILRDKGIDVSIDSLEQKLPLSTNGARMSAIVEIAARMGVTLTGVRCTLEHLDSLGLPAILWVDGDHYVVADSVTDSTVYLRDPARGTVQEPRSALLQRWTGEALVSRRSDQS